AGLPGGRQPMPVPSLGRSELQRGQVLYDFLAAAVDLFMKSDFSVAQQAISGIVVHGALEAMIRLMADPYMLHCSFYVIIVTIPWQRHGFHQPLQTLFLSPRAGLRETLQQALVRHPDDACVHRMMAVIVAILFPRQSEYVVQAEL